MVPLRHPAPWLVIPYNEINARRLAIRGGLVDDAADSMLFNREPRTTDARKARISAELPVRAQAKADRKASWVNVAKAQKQTTNLPDRHSVFHVAAAPTAGKPDHIYSGKDVRKAVFNGHVEAQRVKSVSATLSKSQAKKMKTPLKTFSNYPHNVPKAEGGAKPLPHMTVDKANPHHPPGREFPLPNQHDPGKVSPARIITQKTQLGHQTFKGVIAHDQSRTDKSSPGYNDHFQVKEHKPTRVTV